ncbi:MULTISPECIES: hypothetical protein [unclassified Streptomyces]|uniref:hypothetical protein n=1 Tax=unclassified Streptomyces TaxID=2593676 RepID=UPI000F6CEDFD|nr:MULTISPECIES: hypothetical protein [unclassified Streptomyces]AZM61756.1 hypothetical protein DLM49_21370 [Streptomyces sp. WAC 01438]RSN02209.1 hypothetical protein DMA10_00525 [Streptomyces sp. WAC 01420]
MFERVSAEESEHREALASRVRNELAAAGLPVVTPGLNRVLAGGAAVEVDEGADAAGGVFVGWLTSPRLRECTSRAVRLRLLDDPLLHHSSEVAAAMMQAMAVILASAGFAVEDANDEYCSHQLRVTDGPARVVPMWALRDEEVAMPGWQAASPSDGAE